MIAAIATLRAKEGSEADFLAVAKEMAAAVNANEEGCLSYEIFQGETPRPSSSSSATGTKPPRKPTAIPSISKPSAPAWAPSWPPAPTSNVCRKRNI